MPDRTINWGDPADAGTKYLTQDDDPAGGGNFVVAEDLDGNDILLQWNPTESQWEYGGPVDLGGNDLTNAGAIDGTSATVDTLEAESVNTATSLTDPAGVEHTGELADIDDVGSGGGITDGLPRLPDVGDDVQTAEDAMSALFSSERAFERYSYQSGPNVGIENDVQAGWGAWTGAQLVPDGRVIFPPFNKPEVGIFDPQTGEFTEGPSVSGVGTDTKGFHDAVLLPDGRLLFVPSELDDIYIFDPSDDSVSSVVTVGDQYTGGSLVPDGRVILAPNNADNVGIFDPSDDSFTTGPAHNQGVDTAYIGAVLTYDGRVVFVPRNADDIGIFDPEDDSFTAGPSHGESGEAFTRGTIAPDDGRVILAPFDSAKVGIFDPSDDSYTSGPSHDTTGFQSAQLMPDGRILMDPRDHDVLGIFDPNDDSYGGGPEHGEVDFPFSGLCLLPDGRAVAAPYKSNHIGIINSYAQTDKPVSTALHPLVQTS